MWILIFWLSSPFAVSSNGVKQPVLAVHSQEFTTERACKEALTAMKRVNAGELTLRGVCVPKGE
ncbi:hypothetical protein ACRQPR_004132 [Citrobacter amalonaticus]|uniref:hypothetical protein n=1 Tax=Citrobacter farmeri TaxID=67824 RepID=UPI00050E028B|nr:hypothetical protein [Citrobacter farmeri]MDB2166997.1 hypothetical protein [Citrobacter farmeri]QXA99764.1 hypothetical protein I6L53_23365 [Citrobacter farmeri]GAL51806.1 hypothetical protein CIFAM_22_00750 [Citrobacter farmeri GTC 1319]